MIEEIYSRRSVRTFNSTPVEKDKLEQILRAGAFAPSAMNNTDRQFTAVVNADILNKLNLAVGSMIDRTAKERIEARNNGIFDFHYRSPVLIIVSHMRNALSPEADCAVALENMFLAAKESGLCSCWINQLNSLCDCPSVRDVLTEAGVDPRHKVFGCAAIGYSEIQVKNFNKKLNKIVICD